MRFRPLAICVLFMLLVSCSSSLDSLDFGEAYSPCDVSEEQTGEYVAVGGLLEFVDDTVPDGWYADLERDGCRIGVWVAVDQLADWQTTAPGAFEEEAVAIFAGRLTNQPLPDRPDEFQLIVEVGEAPQVLLTSTGEEESIASDMPACDYSGEEIDGDVEASGEVILMDDSAAAGVYVELDSGGCFTRVWIERRFWDTWTPEQREILRVGNRVTVHGILTIVRGEQTVDISEPGELSRP